MGNLCSEVYSLRTVMEVCRYTNTTLGRVCTSYHVFLYFTKLVTVHNFSVFILHHKTEVECHSLMEKVGMEGKHIS